jgi:hypothetical protein
VWADSRLRRTALPSRERIPHCSRNRMQNKFADTRSVRGKFFQDVTNAGRPLLRGYVGQSSKVYAWDKSAADLCESTCSSLRSFSCSLSVGSCCGPDYVVRRLRTWPCCGKAVGRLKSLTLDTEVRQIKRKRHASRQTKRQCFPSVSGDSRLSQKRMFRILRYPVCLRPFSV